MDQDYLNHLSDEDKSWLSDFQEEFYGANLNFKELKKNRFHKTKKDKKACTDRNNARNRCIYGIAKGGGRVLDAPPGKPDEASINPEDAIIEYIDSTSEDNEKDQ